jgi:hypothetical protein
MSSPTHTTFGTIASRSTPHQFWHCSPFLFAAFCFALSGLFACTDTSAPIGPLPTELQDGTWLGSITAVDQYNYELGGQVQLEIQGLELSAIVRGQTFSTDSLVRTRNTVATRIFRPNDIEGLIGYDLNGSFDGDRIRGQVRVWTCFLCSPQQGVTIAHGSWSAAREDSSRLHLPNL